MVSVLKKCPDCGDAHIESLAQPCNRLRAARTIGAAPLPAESTCAKIADGALMLACVLFAALVAIGFGIWTLIALLIAASARPGFWLGVVVVAVLAHLVGWW